jgi:hypothetical protein
MKTKTERTKDSCVITVVFERSADGDEIDVMRGNFLSGKISVNPYEDLRGALVQQLRLELQGAFDDGMAGSFEIEDVKLNKGFKSPSKKKQNV